MQKSLPNWAFGVLSVVGVVLVASMVFPWVDLGGAYTQRGLSLAWNENHWLFLVPVVGAALVAAAASKSEHTRLAAVCAGMAIAGYVLLNTATSMVKSGVDTWLILGGAGVMIASAPANRTIGRAVGGAMVLVGFFAPWVRWSMFDTLTSDMVAGSGLTIRILWLVPVAALGGILSAGSKTGGKLAAISGVTVYGALLYVIGSVAYMVFGIGAWAALGASTVALVIGVVARTPAPEAIAQPDKKAA